MNLSTLLSFLHLHTSQKVSRHQHFVSTLCLCSLAILTSASTKHKLSTLVPQTGDEMNLSRSKKMLSDLESLSPLLTVILYCCNSLVLRYSILSLAFPELTIGLDIFAKEYGSKNIIT